MEEYPSEKDLVKDSLAQNQRRKLLNRFIPRTVGIKETMHIHVRYSNLMRIMSLVEKYGFVNKRDAFPVTSLINNTVNINSPVFYS